MRVLEANFNRIQFTEVPELKELLTPCPICGGTTDIDFKGHIVCYSCKQHWTLVGKPLSIKEGSIY
jgi:hypothetical protein